MVGPAASGQAQVAQVTHEDSPSRIAMGAPGGFADVNSLGNVFRNCFPCEDNV